MIRAATILAGFLALPGAASAQATFIRCTASTPVNSSTSAPFSETTILKAEPGAIYVWIRSEGQWSQNICNQELANQGETQYCVISPLSYEAVRSEAEIIISGYNIRRDTGEYVRTYFNQRYRGVCERTEEPAAPSTRF